MDAKNRQLALLDSSKETEIARRIAEVEAGFALKDMERELKNKDDQLILKNRLIFWGGIVGLALLLKSALIIFLIIRYRSRNKLLGQRNRELEAKNATIARQADDLQTRNEEMRELAEFKEGMAHTLVHDLNNPLNVLSGHLALPNDFEGKSEMRSAVSRIRTLALNVLDLERLDKENLVLNLEPVLIADLIQAAREETHDLVEQKEIGVAVEIEARPAAIADADYLKRALVNLIANAAKCAPYGGKIRVSAGAENEKTWIEVWHNGPAAPEAQRDQLFALFGKIDANIGAGRMGAGLGLSFCKTIAEAHGGEVCMAEANEGAAFRLTLPAAQAPETTSKLVNQNGALPKRVSRDSAKTLLAPLTDKLNRLDVSQTEAIERALAVFETKARSGAGEWAEWTAAVRAAVKNADAVEYRRLTHNARADRGSRPILLADDDPLNLKTLSLLLKTFKYRNIVTALNGEEALQKIEKADPALIISDFDMPVMNGEELTRRVRENPKTRGLPIIMLTGYANPFQQWESPPDLDAFLVKPVDKTSLLRALEPYFAQHERNSA